METPSHSSAEFDPSARLDVPTGFEQNESGLLLPARSSSVSVTEGAALAAGMQEGRGSFRFNDRGERAENDILNSIERELGDREAMNTLRDIVNAQFELSNAQVELNQKTDSFFGDTNSESSPDKDTIVQSAVERFAKKMRGGTEEGAAQVVNGSEDFQHELGDKWSQLTEILNMDDASFEEAFPSPVEVTEQAEVEPSQPEIEYDENGFDADGYDREGYSAKGFTRTGGQRKQDPNEKRREMNEPIFAKAEAGWVKAQNPDAVPQRAEAADVEQEESEEAESPDEPNPMYGFRNNGQGIPIFHPELVAADRQAAEDEAKRASEKAKSEPSNWVRAQKPNAQVERKMTPPASAEVASKELASVESILGAHVLTKSINDENYLRFLGIDEDDEEAVLEAAA